MFSLMGALCSFLKRRKEKRSVPSRADTVQYSGLKNQGATCYLNTVLQCLFMTKEFRSDIEKSQDSAGLALELKQVFEKLNVAKGTVGTEGITQSLGIRKVHEQQDAVEYYQKILKAVGPQLSKVFEGKMKDISRCVQRGHVYQETRPFITIPLAIQAKHNQVYSVKDGLEAFFRHTLLDEDNWLYCDDCDNKTETETWNEIEECPTILSLHLKRFDYDYRINRHVKNDCPMDIPLSLPIKDCNYDLHAVINHSGSRSGGHYNAIIKSVEDNQWFCFDDSTVTKLDLPTSLDNSRLAYLLLYRKVTKKDKTLLYRKVMPSQINRKLLLRVGISFTVICLMPFAWRTVKNLWFP